MIRAWTPEWAMVFAAGRGTRMMPLTANKPKPMLEVSGKPLLGHALERVAQAGIGNVVVNAHYCAEAVRTYLPPEVTLSYEEELLDTGGGVKQALSANLLATRAPFLAVNSDILWTDSQTPAIARLSDKWLELGDAVDVLLLLVPRVNAWGHDSNRGDYAMDNAGQLTRLSNPDAPYVYAGLQITRPALYDAYQAGEAFSNLKIFDAAEKKGRLYGLVHDGGWFHFSTPKSLELFATADVP